MRDPLRSDRQWSDGEDDKEATGGPSDVVMAIILVAALVCGTLLVALVLALGACGMGIHVGGVCW